MNKENTISVKEQHEAREQIELDKQHLNYEGEDRMVSSLDLKNELAEQPTNGFKLMTPFESLNKAFDGFKYGNLIAIAGHTSHGKTELAIELARHCISERNEVAWFNFETTSREVIKRFERKCGLLPTFYIPRKQKDTFKWFDHKVKESISKFKTKVIFIDSLRELTMMPDINDNHLGSNYSVYVGQVVQRVAKIAIDNNVIIFLLVDPKKADETQSLGMSDVGRDSSLITSIPDAVLTIWQECKRKREGVDYTGNVYLNILKNREYGVKYRIKLKFEDWKYTELIN